MVSTKATTRASPTGTVLLLAHPTPTWTVASTHSLSLVDPTTLRPRLLSAFNQRSTFHRWTKEMVWSSQTSSRCLWNGTRRRLWRRFSSLSNKRWLQTRRMPSQTTVTCTELKQIIEFESLSLSAYSIFSNISWLTLTQVFMQGLQLLIYISENAALKN